MARRRRIVRRRNPDDVHALLQQARIPWNRFSAKQIREIIEEAALYGDFRLYAKAKAALARR
jgi:hypothetical protein